MNFIPGPEQVHGFDGIVKRINMIQEVGLPDKLFNDLPGEFVIINNNAIHSQNLDSVYPDKLPDNNTLHFKFRNKEKQVRYMDERPVLVDKNSFFLDKNQN